MKLAFLFFPNLILIVVCHRCGISHDATKKYAPIITNYTFDVNQRRILGGDESIEGRWPWMAYLATPDFICSATIIGERWILTAAHCLGKKMTVQFGTLESSAGDFNEVVEVHGHSCYKNFHPYDIALLKLKEKIKIINGNKSAFEHLICHHGVNSGGLPGDSGGPSVAFRNGTWIQVGVASFISQNPRTNNRLDLNQNLFHTRVSYYCDWIAKITKNEVQCQSDDSGDGEADNHTTDGHAEEECKNSKFSYKINFAFFILAAFIFI
uniref:Peptidase S1 domain-containing protein n=1 Tax=Panagrolaimus sp. JU765 TaxID=591449 RepID=A0AC34RI25_9BILA